MQSSLIEGIVFKEVIFEAVLDNDWWCNITFDIPVVSRKQDEGQYALRIYHQEQSWSSDEARAFLKAYNLKLVPWVKYVGEDPKDWHRYAHKYIAIPR